MPKENIAKDPFLIFNNSTTFYDSKEVPLKSKSLEKPQVFNSHLLPQPQRFQLLENIKWILILTWLHVFYSVRDLEFLFTVKSSWVSESHNKNL